MYTFTLNNRYIVHTHTQTDNGPSFSRDILVLRLSRLRLGSYQRGWFSFCTREIVFLIYIWIIYSYITYEGKIYIKICYFKNFISHS